MNIFLILTVIIAIIAGAFLHYHKWKTRHILSFIFGFVFVFEFSSKGQSLLTPVFPDITAASLWVISFIFIYIGAAIISTIPLALHNFKKEKRKIINIFKLFIVLGLVYTAIDNFTMGPFAVGPHSPYMNKSLCSLDATYYSEDVFFGCLLEKVGISPYSDLADFLTYNIYSSFLIFVAGIIVGYKKLEKIIFNEE